MISEKNYEIIKSAVAAAKRAGNEIREEKYLNSLDPSSNFRKLLEGLTKAELQEIRRSWAFSDISHLNKAELIEELALRIEENLADWFSLLNLEQLQKVREIISHDGFLYLDEIDFELLAYYREKGVIFSGRYNGQAVLLIPGELLPKMRKIISNNNVEQRASYNDKILRVVRGLLVYYGVLSLMELFHLLEKLMPLSLSSFELKELLQEYANYDCAIKCIDSYILLLDVYDEEKIILEQYQRQDLDFYPVNLKMAERAGSLGHEPWNLTQKRFKKYLMQNYDFSSEEAEEILEICVFNIKNDLGIAEQIKFIQNFIEFSDLDEVNEMSRKLSELHNNTRQWVIKGHTPRELFAEEKKHLRSLPNMEEEYARDKDGTIVRTQEKVGRNDPCPCGSGKKYKRCCGR